MKNIKNICRKKVLILDGATGTELQRRGMPQGVCPEIWCLDNPKVLKDIYLEYLNAGSDMVSTCTFGANAVKLSEYGEFDVKKINQRLTALARSAVGENCLIAGDIGPLGKFIEPFGPLAFEDAVDIFKEQVKGLIQGGADYLAIETMMDIQEARAALIAVKETTDKFVSVSMTYELNGRTLNGTDPLTALITLQSLGADAVGCNCSAGPQDMIKFVLQMKPYAKVPLIAKPNAGIPELIQGKTNFRMGAKEFAFYSKELVLSGVNMLGGCCGTTPAHIKELKKVVSKIEPQYCLKKSISALSSARKNLVIDRNKPLVIIGECINPTGKKVLREELQNGKTSEVRRLIKEQENKGANLLDINVGAPGVDEKQMLKRIVQLASLQTNLPLVIDSSDPEAVEKALRVYSGRALVNSISAEKGKMKKFLEITKKYGAMFILLPLSDKGLPKDFDEAKENIHFIYSQSKMFGFTKDDIVVDGLAMPISSNPGAALETLKTISWCSKIFKISTVIGLSNVSFGMPKRALFNATYLSIAQSQGLNMVISNPLSEEVMSFSKAADALIQKDKGGLLFCSNSKKDFSCEITPSNRKITPRDKVSIGILEGNKEDIKKYVQAAIESGEKSYDLIHKIMLPAINKVGELFNKKEYFLPQLISSAETMKIAFVYLKPYLSENKLLEDQKKNVVILATVKDDVHDIGKNIVSLMLENQGVLVVDLGKDVQAEKIIKEIKKYKPILIALSALMTTTMVNMKEVIDLSRKKGLDCPFMLGGAVVTKSYAQSLGAEYAKDGVEAVTITKKFMRK